MLPRSLALGLAVLALVASPARADPPGRDLGGGGGTVTLGPATLTLAEAPWITGEPFVPFRRQLFPELTFRLRPMFGFEPFAQARTLLPPNPGSSVDSDFGFRYRAGRFHAGARFHFVREARGFALDALGYARYAAPRYDVTLADDARLPLTWRAASTHRFTASAGLKPSPAAPALRVSTSVRDDGAGALSTARLFGTF